MHQINNVTVRDGKVALSGLPFADGEQVRVTVTKINEPAPKSLSIEEVRKLIKGGVVKFDDPFEPMIPVEDWEMLK